MGKNLTIDAKDLPGLVRSGWSETEFTREVIKLAQLHGWLAAHFRPARAGKGWRTAVQGDGAGFPDLVLSRTDGILIFAELKVGKNDLSEAQREWKLRLVNSPAEYRIWRPEDWNTIVLTLSSDWSE